MRAFRRSDDASHEFWNRKHKFEHWYRDHSIYFITARCRGKFPAFESEQAKAVFWQRFDLAIASAGFQPWIISLLDNHYHLLGYLARGDNLPSMMQTLHGGAAKLVNDILRAQYAAGGFQPAWNARLDLNLERNQGALTPFWCDSRRKKYFDGCLRSERQGRKTYRYVLTQAVRHGIVSDWRQYRHTRVYLGLEEAIAFACERRAFLRGVAYKRYEMLTRSD